MNTKELRIIFALILIFSLGIFLGFEYCNFYTHPLSTLHTSSIRETNSGYKYIDPLLLSADTSQSAPEYNPLQKNIASYTQTQIAANNAEDISVYFRDMNSGLWTGVNENNTYDPASMIKIAVLIACLKSADVNPSLLNETVSMSPQSSDLNYGQFYPPKDPIVKGKVYTVKELMNSMIVESDNNAMALLVNLIGPMQIDTVLADLKMPSLESPTQDYMSPKLYSRFYRILYNSSYLTQQDSEQALDFLVQNDFSGGIYSGVPNNISVAQKFGERTATDTDGTVERELHDCGIVYYPNNPYFLCVMTKGTDFTKLQSIISTISKITWNEFSKNDL